MRVFLLLLVLINIPLFGLGSNYYSVRWDAYDSWYPVFSLIGQGLRGGYFTDFVPHLLSGYSIGGDSQMGLYNPIFFISSYLFPASVLSINFVLMFLYAFSGYVCHQIGRQFKWDRVPSIYFALSVIACGAMTGNASHLTYIISYLSFFMVLLGLIKILHYQVWKSGGFYIFFGTWFLLTAGYPPLSLSSFVASISIIVFYYCFEPTELVKKTSVILGSVAAGLAISLPALMHYFATIQLSNRELGLTVEQLSLGSLPWSSFISLFIPIKTIKSGIDITMVQFNLLFGSAYLIYKFFRNSEELEIWSNLKKRSIFVFSFYFLLICLVLSLGDNVFPPLRIWLGQFVGLFCVGRFLCSEFKLFALLILAGYSCCYLNHYLNGLMDSAKRKKIILLLLLDFILVMSFKRRFILDTYERDHKNHLQMVYDESSQEKLDLPRVCESKEVLNRDSGENSFAIFRSSRFSASGYVPTVVTKYFDDFSKISWAVCAPGRLFSVADKKRLDYKLITHEPGYIRFEFEAAQIDQLFLWAEARDSFWNLKINGIPSEFEDGPGHLRYFRPETPSKDGRYLVEMIYLGPVSKYFRADVYEWD